MIVSANIAIAETAERARELLLPEAWAMTASRTHGDFPPLSPIADILARSKTDRQATMLEEYLNATIHGTSEQVAARLGDLIERTGAAELLVTTNTYDTAELAELDRRLAELFRA